MTRTNVFPARAVVDLSAVAHNITVMRQQAGDAEVMAVVKANAYGHGRKEVALAAYQQGIRRFGVSQLAEALKLREELDEAGIARDQATILTWMAGPGETWREALAADLELSVSDPVVLERIALSAIERGIPARVHVKVDTGMSRGGAVLANFPALATLVAQMVAVEAIEVVGLWSHLARADDPTPEGLAATARQVEIFEVATAQLADHKIIPPLRHLAATAGALWHPETHYDMVRIGIGLYGLSPDPAVKTSAELNLIPVLQVEAPLMQVKQVPAGTAVSYGGTWTCGDAPHWIGVVPLGYADGLPRHGSSIAPVMVISEAGPRRSQIIGRICMDQCMIDLGDGELPLGARGDTVILFGKDGPAVDEWAELIDTINYEIVARIAPTIPRYYLTAD